MKHYVLVRALGGGFFEYIANVPGMQPTQSADMAAQITEKDIVLFDRDYLEREGYRLEPAESIGAQPDQRRLFTPPLAFYRPRIARRRGGQLAVREAAHMVPVEKDE